MDDLMKYLYHFVMENRVDRYLNAAEYSINASYSEKHLQWLKDHLDGGTLRHLEDYSSMCKLARAEWEAAVFRAGLSLGLELGRC